MKVIFSPRSRRDLDSIFKYLHKFSPKSAAGAIDAIETGVTRLKDHPYQAPLSSAAGARVLLVRRYRLQIFYRVQDDIIGIVHIRHTARNPFVNNL